MADEKNPVVFPPYGVMTLGDVQQFQAGPEVPPALSLGEGCDLGCRQQFWEKWRAETEDVIADLIWPKFDARTLSWQGAGKAAMAELTEADLDLIINLRTNPAGGKLAAKPQSPLIAPDCPVQMKFFQNEDQTTTWFSFFHFYDTTFNTANADDYNSILADGVLSKVATTHYQFKVRFQRPRPYQTAVLLNKKFSLNRAITALTPALPCGHCLQSLFGVGAVMESLLVGNSKVSPNSWVALEQFAADIGDRRVYAGVHYPSDNLVSWIIAMRLAGKVFRLPETRRKLWSVITERSDVYKAIAKSPAHQAALQILHNEAP